MALVVVKNAVHVLAHVPGGGCMECVEHDAPELASHGASLEVVAEELAPGQHPLELSVGEPVNVGAAELGLLVQLEGGNGVRQLVAGQVVEGPLEVLLVDCRRQHNSGAELNMQTRRVFSPKWRR